MPTFVVAVAPDQGAQLLQVASVPVEVAYRRAVDIDGDQQTVPAVAREDLPPSLTGEIELVDPAIEAVASVRFLAANGQLKLARELTIRRGADRETVTLTVAEVAVVMAPEPRPAAAIPTTERSAAFVDLTGLPLSFAGARLLVKPVRATGAAWTAGGFDQVFNVPASATTSVVGEAPALGSAPWAAVAVGLDGHFTAGFELGAGDAWIWALSGPVLATGIVVDDLRRDRVPPISILLPAAAKPGLDGAAGGPALLPTRTVPLAESEREVADNPQMYSEDPGEFCRPFSNPERVLGERSFSVLYRAEQPILSAISTLTTVTAGILDFDIPNVQAIAGPSRSLMARMIGGVRESVATAVRPTAAPGTLVRDALPAALIRDLVLADQPRRPVDAAHPVQWDAESSRYQAVTVARGHILEFRARWRSNGYSLGTVAKTLTLAPRQVRRIQRVEWQRLERSRREERTELVDRVSDQVSRDRQYDDAVQATLSEWSRGESESSTSAGAGGFGFATAGFIIGGGGGHSNANTTASQDGGRRTTASEETRLRDTIRRYGESLRRLESVVINEVTQEETVTGTSEVVRNPNYGHSLTVIYYQILRHLKVETAFSGVRECLFVPFAIKPFTVARTFRWRDLLSRGLLDRRHRLALRHLKDVLNGFIGSDIPAGPRSKHRVRHVSGSMFVRIGVARPPDNDDGVFNAGVWALLNPFLGAPAAGIFERLAQLARARRDAVFQQDHAPGIAAGWVNTIRMRAGNQPLNADFTLATRYQFNNVVRVDFSLPVTGQSLDREGLSSIRFMATRALPPGSVANLERLTLTYQTDQFQRTVTYSQGSQDLITPETGAVELAGASLFAAPDAWEIQDVRAEITRVVNEFVQHLNEHAEHYHKVIWWNMDRDRLFMLVDGHTVPGTAGVSIGSVIERDPIAIMGNAIVFRVSPGSFLGIDDIVTPAQLWSYYSDKQFPSEPMLVSLPTDGLYAQTIMDECEALEEHYGSTDWVLSEDEPEVDSIPAELLMTRRTAPEATTPSPLPATLINLQNAPEAPAPTGLAAALGAITNANAFRDITGIAGTQANAAAGLQTAAGLATTFGNQAAALKLADMAAKAQATKDANQKLATIKSAVDKSLVTPATASDEAAKVLNDLHAPSSEPPHQNATLADAVRAAKGRPGSDIFATPDTLRVTMGGGQGGLGGFGGFGGQGGLPSAQFASFPFPVPFEDEIDTVREWMRKVARFKEEAVRTAQRENTTWAGRPESDPAVLPFLVEYGRAGHAANPAAWAASAAADTTAWSAGFISFVVQEAEILAGFTSDPFGRSTLHSDYIAAAKRNRLDRVWSNPFWLYRLTEVQPEEGDFLCKNRGGTNAVTFDSVQAGDLTHVDIVTSVTAAQLLATGGNRLGGGLTVAEGAVPRTNGFVTAASANLASGPYFAILRVRTNPLEGISLVDPVTA